MSAGEDTDPVIVPPDVKKAIELVRSSGLTNMLDRATVAILAEGFGFNDAAYWIRANRDAYGRGFVNGYVAAPASKQGGA